MQDVSVEIMDVTDNYYDDLATRFDFPSHRLGAPKRLRILYDEDKFGVFIKYLPNLSMENSALVNVQRDGYRGYGFPNAQLRLTIRRLRI